MSQGRSSRGTAGPVPSPTASAYSRRGCSSRTASSPNRSPASTNGRAVHVVSAGAATSYPLAPAVNVQPSSPGASVKASDGGVRSSSNSVDVRSLGSIGVVVAPVVVPSVVVVPPVVVAAVVAPDEVPRSVDEPSVPTVVGVELASLPDSSRASL